MSNLDKWLIFIAATPLFILFSESFGLPPSASTVLLLIILTIPLIVFGFYHRQFVKVTKNKLLIFFCLFMVLFNIILSEDIFLSLQYWVVYVALIYGFYIWLVLIKPTPLYASFLHTLTLRIGVFVGLSAVMIFVLLLVLNITSLRTFNSLGIISGSAIAFLYFAQDINKKFKWILIILLAIALFSSLSRSSLIFTVLSIVMVETLLSNQNRGRKVFVLLSGIVFTLFYSDNLLNWLSEKELSAFTSFAQIQTLNDDRSLLINQFLDTYTDNFFTGYGVNVYYGSLPAWDKVENTHVHNGILDTILQVGVPLGIIFVVFYFKALKKAFKLARKNARYAAIFGFLMYYLIRGYGESYFMLNIGNPMSISVIILIVFLLHHEDGT